MKKIEISFQNCYGIKNLNCDFDFSNTSAYAIYAPNGFMKTSFAKAFRDISENKQSKDLIFEDLESIRTVICDGQKINKENVFVIEPYNEKFGDANTSLLLVNSSARESYEKAVSTIENNKNELMSFLSNMTKIKGPKNNPESILTSIFINKDIYELLLDLQREIRNYKGKDYSNIPYLKLFNEKTLALLNSGEIKEELRDYIEKYYQLINNSPILSSNFNLYDAEKISSTLKDSGFFKAQHTINLKYIDSTKSIDNHRDLEKTIETEKNLILNNEELKNKFDKIDDKLSTKELRDFRDYLINNKDILPELLDHKKFQQNIWISLINQNINLYKKFVDEYLLAKEDISKAVQKAKEQKTKWEEVINIYNQRFLVPFILTIKNKEDVILKGLKPEISFEFKNHDGKRKVEKDTLIKTLSQGEKRALHLLEIIFEINSRITQCIPTLLIIDDIADSFDYKNKYAIIEYLREICENPLFKCIFLTHNYDFHRAISSRIPIEREYRLFAHKNNESIKLKKEKYQKNPFEFWKNNLSDEKYLVSAITFFRNLSEYCGNQEVFNNLTALLHQKQETATITIGDLEKNFKKISDIPNINLDKTKKVIDLIFEVADKICDEDDEQAELESKIILAIAIRHSAEKILIKKINDQDFIHKIESNQTMILIKEFKRKFNNENGIYELLDQVNLMTPENIHLNSFMFEPLLDMSPANLKNLFKKLKEKLETREISIN